MFPSFELFGITIRTYYLNIVLTFIFSILISVVASIKIYKNYKKYKLFILVGLWPLIGTLFALLFGTLENIIYSQKFELGNLSLLGTLFFGPIYFYLSSIILKIDKKDTFNLLSFEALFILGFLKIGCFLNGCCYGIVSDVGFIYPFETVKRFPVQLLETFIFFLLSFLSLLLIIKKKETYYPSYMFFCVYPISRIFLEFLRDNTKYFGFSAGQINSIVFLILFIVVILVYKYKDKNKENLDN